VEVSTSYNPMGSMPVTKTVSLFFLPLIYSLTLESYLTKILYKLLPLCRLHGKPFNDSTLCYVCAGFIKILIAYLS
jgi:hypothetical protein